MKEFIFQEVKGKNWTTPISIKAESVDEAIKEFGADEIILPHQKFTKMYFGNIYEVKESGQVNPLKIVHKENV